MITFRDVTPENFEAVIALQMKEEQAGFMENNLYSLAEAKVFTHLEPRGIYYKEELIGFLLYYFQPAGSLLPSGPGEGEHAQAQSESDYVYLKRIMLGAAHQGKGLGRAAMEAALTFFKEEYPPISFVELMHYADNSAGASLYTSLGYEATGEIRRTPKPGREGEFDEEIVRRCAV